MRVLYGFSSTQAPFNHMPPEEIPRWLQGKKINAVFVSPSEKQDILKRFHEAGILCFQEFTVFASRTLYRKHPTWRPVTLEGEALKPDGWYHGLSPNQPDLRKKRLDEFHKRLQNPYIQGIWLDFIRYAGRWEKPNPTLIDNCFSPASLSQFQAFANLRFPSSSSTRQKAQYILKHHSKQWVDFKVETIRSWVQEAYDMRNRLRPGCLIGLFGVPWTPADHDGAIRRIMGQDDQVLAPLIDVFSPMVYHRLCGKPLSWIEAVTLSVRKQTQKPVWPIVQAKNDPDVLSPDEFRKAVKTGAHASQQGVILFTAQSIEQEKRWEDVRIVFEQY